MDDIRLKLVRLGFTQNEAAVYLALLQLDSALVQDIARLAQVKRVTTYSVLKSLVKKGLVSEFKKADELRYAAESPMIIQALLAVEERELTVRQELAAPLVERLQVFFQKNSKKPKIRYVDSLEGLRVMQKEFEQIGEDIFQIVGLDTFDKLHGRDVNREHLSHLEEKGRKIRAILVTDRVVASPKETNIEFLTISPSLVPIKGEMTVCGDRTALFSYSDSLVAIDIHSVTIAEMVRNMLELAWKEVERLNES